MPPAVGAGRAPVPLDRRSRALVGLVAVVVAVALPALMRSVGIASDQVSLAVQGGLVIIVGLVAGPVTGVLAGAAMAVVGFGLTGSPTDYLVPFVAMELAGSGLVAGLLARRPLFPLAGVLLAQAGGRLARLVAVAIAADGFSEVTVAIGEGWESVRGGLVAIMLQWLLVPPIVLWLRGWAASREAPERA
ncbi:MAG: hypothetical protein AAGC63_04220 [Propionicimonas sp.]|nr:hypothetical protein [Propionicimonas sp.]